MKKKIILTILSSLLLIAACKKSSSTDENSTPDKIALSQNYVPYGTEKSLRICYMLNTWEFMKEGLKLQAILVYDLETKAGLDTILQADLPKIWKAPLPSSPEYASDNIARYYLSLQVPIPLSQSVPSSLMHRFILTDTTTGGTVTIDGGIVPVRKSDVPRMIAPPVKGDYYLFHNQSTKGYRFRSVKANGNCILNIMNVSPV